MKKLPLVIFLFILCTALCSSVCSYRRTAHRIDLDIHHALALTLAEKPYMIISPDTIQSYRSNLTIAELKDTAYIALKTVRHGSKHEIKMVPEANCSFVTVFKLSDQKASGALLFIGIIWMLGSLWYMRKRLPERAVSGLAYGGIVYDNRIFTTSQGEVVHLTPMQHTLLEMFMQADNHTLHKQDICNRLWPKKPDANDTLYTLIRRLKPIIEAHSNLKIESNRGHSYTLKQRQQEEC